MRGVWIDKATGASPVFPVVDAGTFDLIATRAVEAGAVRGQELLKSGIARGRSQWERLSNWTILIRLAQGRPSNKINYDTGDYLRAIEVKKGENRVAEVGILNPKGPKGQDMEAIGRVMEGGATIRVTEKMRAWFASKGLHLKESTTHIHIPPRPVFGLATPEIEDTTNKVVDPFLKEMEALFVK